MAIIQSYYVIVLFIGTLAAAFNVIDWAADTSSGEEDD
jgi:hypothetical protein